MSVSNIILKTLRDGTISNILSNVPYAGNFYSAWNSAITDSKLEELAIKIEKADIKIEDIKEFIQQNEQGWFMFKKVVEESVNSTNKKISLFVEVLKGAIQRNNDFDTEYHKVMIETLARMTETEITFLAFIFKYFEEIDDSQRYDKKLDNHLMITVIENSDNEVKKAIAEGKIWFEKYIEENMGKEIHSNIQFIISRLINHGLLEETGSWAGIKHTSILAELLYKYIRKSTEQMQSIPE